jgi:ABC-2 type transport system permease protein
MIKLVLAELRRQFAITFAYPVNQAAQSLIPAVFFYMMYSAAQFMSDPATQFGSRLDLVVADFFVWIVVLASMYEPSRSWREEAQIGTLDQLMLSPHGALRIFLVRSWVGIIAAFLTIAPTAVLIVILCHAHVHYSLGELMPTLGAASAGIGIGFIFASIVLVAKRMDAISSLIGFVVFGPLAVPLETFTGHTFWLCSLLPFAPSGALLRVIAVHQEFDWLLLLLSLANGVAYLLVGCILFRWAMAKVKRQGLLGKY